MAANEVVWYDSSETGAPTLNNAAGALIAVLDACLKDGFNSKSVTSLVVASGVATLTISAHGYFAGRMIDVAGVTGGMTGWAGLNARQKILAVTANTATFDATGISDGTATGTITTKRSPLGWTKPYSGTNKAVYARSDVAATAMLLRIDDTATGAATVYDARATMYETMSDVDTGTSPTTSYYWNKGANSATAKKWTLFGDGRLFYLFTQANQTYATRPMGFGDIVSYRPADAYHCVVFGQTTSATGGALSPSGESWPSGAYLGSAPPAGLSFARAFSGFPGAVAGGAAGLVDGNGTYPYKVPGAPGGIVFPSPVDNGMVIQKPLWACETAVAFRHPIRGEFPGIASPVADLAGYVDRNTLDRLEFSNIANFSGTMVAQNFDVIRTGAVAAYCALLIDVTGPWR